MTDMEQGTGTPNQPPPGNSMPPGQAPGSAPAAAPSNERTMGMLCHLLAFSGYIIPFGHIIGPLVIWLVKKDESAFVDAAGKESLNFQITVTIASLICLPLVFILIGIPLLIAVAIANVVLVIIAAVKTNEGVAYRYPYSLRLIK